jgi:hypothetical protein
MTPIAWVLLVLLVIAVAFAFWVLTLLAGRFRR